MSYTEINIEYLIRKKVERLKYDALEPKDRNPNNKPCVTCRYLTLCLQDVKENNENPDKRLCVQVNGHVNEAIWRHYHKP